MQAWPDHSLRVIAVEPAAAMSTLGRTIEQCLFAQGQDSDELGVSRPIVRWSYGLPRTDGLPHDLVVAAYTLGELPSEQARKRAVADLWACTKEVLVLVEAGTPTGSTTVRAARQQVHIRTAQL